ncbi:S-layer homology domain-containing protein [Paenibacillus wenxiniae]|uniref:S-layer homology domain-containing protein n=1 Tax=Paenibacillus wenxiniae TaxID=1636843 RepID=A0ABW4RQ93_9BACL
MKQDTIQVKKGLFAPRLVQTSLCSLLVASAFGPVASAATEVKANITKIANKGNSAYLEFSVPMVGGDILSSTGFESGEETPNFYWRGTGNQSITNNPVGSGRVASLQDTITNSEGNLYDFPNTKGDTSRFALQGRSLPDDALISVQFDALSTAGTNWMQFAADTGWYDRGFDMIDDHGQNVLYAEAINWSRAPQTFRVKTASGRVVLPDGQVRTVVSSRTQDYSYGLLQYQWSQTNQTFTRIPGATQPWSAGWPNGQTITPKLESFAVDERVLSYNQGGFIFPERVIPSDRTWRTYSMNAQVSKLAYYDLMKYGISPSMQWKTDGSVYIDNLKFGYAEKANIYRDGQQVYSGFESSFTDYDATDTAKPDPVTHVDYSFSRSNKQITVNWTAASDTGTNYTYKIQGQLRDGTTGSIQDPHTVRVTSGMKGYILVCDSSPYTQVTSGEITTTATTATLTPAYGDRYIHIASVDQAGNISATMTTTLTDRDQPELQLTQIDTSPSKYGTIVSVNASDLTSWIDSITLPGGSVVQADATSFVINRNGGYTFRAMDFFGNIVYKTITVSNIDTLPPDINVSSEPAELAQFNPQPFTLHFNVTDNMPGQPQVYYYMSTNSDIPASDSAVWQSVGSDFKVDVDKVGAWWVFVKVRDVAGNEQTKRFGMYNYLPIPKPIAEKDIEITSATSTSLTIKLKREQDAYYRVYVNGVTDRRKVFRNGADMLTLTDLTPGTLYTITIETHNTSGIGGQTVVNAMTRPDIANISTILPVEGTEDTVIASVYQGSGTEHYVWELFNESHVKIMSWESKDHSQLIKVTPNGHYSLHVYAVNRSGAGLTGVRNFQALPTLSGLHVVNVKSDAIHLGWQSVTGDVYYDLYRDDRKAGIRVGAEGTVIGDTYTSVTTATYMPDMIHFNDPGLQSGTEYHYRIAAANAAGYSLWRNVSVWTLPDRPTLRVSEVTDHSLVCDWQQVRGATAYDVYLNGTYIGRQAETRIHLPDLEAGTDYHIDVLAINVSGTGAAAHLTKATLPVQPRLGALLPDEDRVTIQIDTQAADRYTFEYNGVIFESVASHPSIQVTGLRAGETITGTLTAYNASGASKPLVVTMHTLPGAVTNLRATPSESDTSLTWDKVTGAIRYWVETSHGLIAVDHNYFTAEASAPNTFGTYRVWAEGVAGKSVHAAEVSSLGVPIPMDAQPVRVKAVGNDGVTLAFTSFQGATGYHVYFKDKWIAQTNDTSYRINKLQSATEYNQYSIRAVNAVSKLSKSYPISFTTLPADEFTLDVVHKSAHSIDIHIQNVEPTAKVIVRLQLHTGEMKEMYSGEAGYVSIDHLSADTSYKIWVHTISAGGPSHPKFIIVRTNQPKIAHLAHLVPNPSYLITSYTDSSQGSQVPVSPTDQLPPHPVTKNATKVTFHDLEGRYSKEAVHMLAEKGIIAGYADDTFRPKLAITRAEFIAMLDKAGLIPMSTGKPSFTDVAINDWFADAVERAAHANLIQGYPNQTFKPNQILSRAEAATIIGRLHVETAETTRKNTFSDEEVIPLWAKEEIEKTSYFVGYDNGKFEPKKNISREEVAIILYRMLNQ